MKRIVALTMIAAVSLTALPALAQAQDTQPEQPARRARQEDRSLRVGQMAPTFALPSFDGKSETDVREFRGKRPVIVFFGSYT